MRNGLIFMVIATAAALLINGCVTTEQKTASHRDIVMGKKIAIKSYGWHEDCNKWESGDTVNIAFSSSKPVGFSAHYREKRNNENIGVWEKSLTDRYDGSIAVQGDEVYCFMWHNENPEDITLTYDMSVAGK
jgi:hypothetical protein